MTLLTVPSRLRAAQPAEARGLRRDGARLCVVERATRSVHHTRVADLGAHLRRGDLLVVNSSRTIPAALDATREDGSPVQLRPWVRQWSSWYAIAVATVAPHAPVPLRDGELLEVAGTRLRVAGRLAAHDFLWRIELGGADSLDLLLRHGTPIRYSYVPRPVAAEHLQTVYAAHPGSAEPPSAGLHLTWELLIALRRQGVRLADIVLHCGLSSTQDDAIDATHPLLAEWFSVSPEAAASVSKAQRVVAVGTTVVRALESAAAASPGAGARVAPFWGWTELAVTERSRLRAVDGLLTGLHEPQASHLEMLRALVDAPLLERAHTECLERGYLWHELGDAMLIL